MNHKRKNGRKKKRGSRKVLWGLLWFLLILLIGYAIYSFSHSSNVNVLKASHFKAAIVDHLSLYQPNQTFIQTATHILKSAGFTVDYYPSEEVTVEFYKNLPTHDYGLIILRVHSALADMRPPLALFTSEPYSNTKYVFEQLTGQIVSVAFLNNEEPKEPYYFGITHEFIKHSMIGELQKTTIIMMGCNGLTYTFMAEAFIEKGAEVYVSWSNSVLVAHTDLATARLLQHFIAEKRTLKEAVKETHREVGSDPSYNSLLSYHPLEAGNYTIQSVAVSLPIDITEIKIQDVLKKMK